MPRQSPVKSGDPLSARLFNRVADNAYAGATPSTGMGLETRISGRGVTIALTPTAEQLANALRCTLTSAENAPLFGVVEVYETTAGYTGPPIGRCRRPSHYGFGWLGILLEGASQNTAPLIQRLGLCPVKYNGAVVIGDRLGGAKDSYFAVPDPGGPFIVRELPDIVIPDAFIAIVEITGDRLDSKMVDCDSIDPVLTGPYKTIIYKGRTIAITSPGLTETS